MSLASYEFERASCQSRYEETLRSWGDKLCLKRFPLLRACIGEFFGTMVLVIFGTSAAAQAIFARSVSPFSVPFGWGAAVTFGVIISGKMGYGLINPAMALAMALVAKVPWIAIVPIMLCELLGAYIGALVVYGIYQQNIQTRFNGTLNMDSGLIFVTGPSVGNGPALMDQIIGTALLAALVLALADKHNFGIPDYVQPLYIFILITNFLGALGVNAGAALNPARDFGPRLALITVGYGLQAFTHENFYFWVPIVGPFIGACIGAVGYELTIGVHLRGLHSDYHKHDHRELDKSQE